MIFQSFGSKQVSNFYLNSILVQTGPRGDLRFVGTVSVGSRTGAVGLKGIWTHQIVQYLFGQVVLLDPLDLDLTDGVKREGMLTGVARFPARYGQGEVDGELLLDGDGEEVADGV
jgi:hypothetical protein